MAPAIRGPILLGQPSPSLRWMRRMDRPELAAHLQRLREEAGHVERRISRLQRHREQADESRWAARFTRLVELHDRLLALIQEGRRLYRVQG